MFLELVPNLYLKESILWFFGARLQTRMTVIRLGDGRLFVHSPTTLDAATRTALDRLGPVAFVVSPNKIHHQAIGEYAEAYPDARILASPGLVERRRDVRFDGVLGDAPEPEWAAELDQTATRGNVFFSEILFLHRASRTLLVADLIENIHRETVSPPPARWLLALFAGYARPVASPEFRMYTHHPEAAREGFRKLHGWDFERIVLAHGRLIERDARAVVRNVCDELLRGVERRGPMTRRLYAFLARHQ
jgi:hypothetical protein